MRIDVLSIFPELFDVFLVRGMVERARAAGALEVRTTDLRAFTNDRHHCVDDRPYGGGPGMLLKPEPVCRALDVLVGDVDTKRVTPVLLCPQGERLTQTKLEELAVKPHLVMLCGRYEGFDERILSSYPWQHVSVGDYVLSGGEVPAMVVIEGIARLLPGVLGHPDSARRDSFSEWTGDDGLDHPHYTRPPEYRGGRVPDILKSGDHGAIEEWRKTESARRRRSTS